MRVGRRSAGVLVGLLGILALTACGGGGGNSDPAERGRAPIEGAPTIEVVGDDFRFDPDQLAVNGEAVNVAFTSEDIFHTFVVETGGGDQVVAAARRGETDRGGIRLPPGEHVFYCDVPGHRQAGMEGTLVVG